MAVSRKNRLYTMIMAHILVGWPINGGMGSALCCSKIICTMKGSGLMTRLKAEASLYSPKEIFMMANGKIVYLKEMAYT